MKIILLGPPGSGKGTESENLIKDLHIPQISTGDIFRSNVKAKTPLGEEAKAYINEGKLVPDELVINLVIDRLKKDDHKKGYILDGFPRTIKQAEVLDKVLKNDNDKIDYVLYFDVPKETLIKRIAGRRVCKNCGTVFHVQSKPPEKEGICDICKGDLILRKDDKEVTANKRIDIYNTETLPLIDYYEKKGLLKSFKADIGIKELHKEILKTIGVQS
ncbi:MAG: adenylate kinase [Clostridiales Family XIII bacterium]|jgi:adenylate kinase|nr:adenylate kinase [Clostridiales Family XIII bacterium]